MKAILVATDLSNRSDRAVERALRLATDLDVPCHVVSIVDDDLPGDLLARQTEDVQARLERFVANAAAPAQQVTTAVITGDPVIAINDAAEDVNAGLVVVGLHRMRAFLDTLRETTMERLVRYARRPVLLVHEIADHSYAKVLAPVGFSPACAQALRTAKAIAPNAELRLFHAVLSPFSGLTGEGPSGPMARAVRAEATAARDAWLHHNDLQDGLPEVEIITGGLTEVMSRLSSPDTDLIVVGAHLRGGYAPHVLGGFVADLIRKPPCDILVARGKTSAIRP